MVLSQAEVSEITRKRYYGTRTAIAQWLDQADSVLAASESSQSLSTAVLVQSIATANR